MAAPITFRNVPGAAAPNLTGSLLAAQRATEGPNVFQVFGDLAQDEVNTQRKLDTDAFVAQLNNFRDQDLGGGNIVTADAQRQDFLTQALQDNSFINAGVASKAVTDNRAQDFLQNAEGRAQETQADSLLNTASARAIDEANIAFTNTKNILGQQEVDREKLAIEDRELERGELAAVRTETQAQREEAQRKRDETAVTRHLSGIETVISPETIAKHGVSVNDEGTDSHRNLNNLRIAVRNRIKDENPGISKIALDAETDEAMDNAGLTGRFAEAKRLKNLTPTQRKKEATSKLIDESLAQSRIDGTTVPRTSPAYRKMAVQTAKAINANNPNTEQKIQLEALMKPAKDSYVPDISGFPILKKKAAKMSRSEVAAFERKMSTRIKNDFDGYTLSSQEIQEYLQRGITQLGDTVGPNAEEANFASEYITAKSGFRSQLNVASELSKLKEKEALFPTKNKIEAAEIHDKKEASITASGIFVQKMKDDVFNTFTKNFPNREIDRADTDEFITRSIAVLKARTNLTPGEINTRVRSAIDNQGGVENISLWINEAGFVDSSHTVEEADDIRNDTLFDLLMNPRTVATGSLLTFPGRTGGIPTPKLTETAVQDNVIKLNIEIRREEASAQIIRDSGREPSNLSRISSLKKQRQQLINVLNDFDKKK